VTYLDAAVRSRDGKRHAVQLHLDLSAEWSTNLPADPVVWSRYQVRAWR